MAKPTPRDSIGTTKGNPDPPSNAVVIGQHAFEVGLGALLVGSSTGVVAGLLGGPLAVVVGTLIGALAGACAGEVIGEMIKQQSDNDCSVTYATRQQHSHPPVDELASEPLSAVETKRTERESWIHFDSPSKDRRGNNSSESDES